jgi:vesicle transport through interaction with t-SNAREs protein 1
MDVELLSLPIQTRNSMTPRVKAAKEQVRGYHRDLVKLQSTSRVGAERDALLGSHNFELESRRMDQRSRLIDGTERLQDSSRRLEEAQRIALETEGVGISTLEDLNRQREQMLRTRDGLSTADAWIGRSQGVLRGMNQR